MGGRPGPVLGAPRPPHLVRNELGASGGAPVYLPNLYNDNGYIPANHFKTPDNYSGFLNAIYSGNSARSLQFGLRPVW